VENVKKGKCEKVKKGKGKVKEGREEKKS